jgi:PAS domain S-box-containing protein
MDKANILLVDDQPGKLLSYESVLTELGENLVLVRSGREALQMLLKQEFALILLDVIMPEMDGFETAALIRERPRLQHTPIVFITSYTATDMDRLKGYQLGAVDFVFAPIVPEILRAKVLALVELYRKRQELAQANEQLRTEIAERKHAEQRLKESEERFRLMVENVRDYAILMLDPQGRVVTWNAGAERLKGYTAKEIINQHFSRFYPADDVARGKPEMMLRLAAAEGRSEDEGWRLRKDGTAFWANVVITALRDQAGQLFGFAKISRDLTELKRAEQGLRESERRYRQLTEATQDGIVVADEQGIITLFNPASEQMFGYTATEVVGKPVTVLMPEEYHARHLRGLERYLQTRQARIIGQVVEMEGQRKDGHRFSLEVALTPLKGGGDNGSDEIHFLAALRDVTERKRAEERALQTERLAAIGQMVTGLAHESRNALQHIQATVEMLNRRLRPGAEADLLAGIQKAHDRLLHLLENVRGYAAPLKLEYEAHDLAHIWQEAWKQLAPLCQDREVYFHEDTGGLDLRFLVDAYPIERLFRNIFENALAACADPVKINLRCSAAQINGQAAVRVSVTDNGCGLSAEQRQRIFEPFYTTKTRGTGLGMAIAKRIVEAHGGQIAVGNGSGVGTTIEVSLPRGRS